MSPSFELDDGDDDNIVMRDAWFDVTRHAKELRQKRSRIYSKSWHITNISEFPPRLKHFPSSPVSGNATV